MGKIIYVTGGTRSGKSKFAENLILKSQGKKIYVATSIPFDEEMKNRISKHRERRDNTWITIESYKGLSKLLESYREQDVKILLDCITNLVSNYMILENNLNWDKIISREVEKIENTIFTEIRELIEFIKSSKLELVVVSSEVGMGLIPEYPLGRYFRDIVGIINQYIALEADEAFLVVSGLSIRLK